MAKVKFSDVEIQLMRDASNLGSSNGWSLTALKPVKDKIKQMKRKGLQEKCCYCLRDTTGEFNMVLDIEHIIPKGDRLRNMFTMKNLSVSCKRCNMKIKSTDTSFLSMDISELPRRAFRSRYYKFVHPNLDAPEKHIKRLVFELTGECKFIKYIIVPHSNKGLFTYEYFKLKELEVEAADRAQGRPKKNFIIDNSVAKIFDGLKNQFNQL